MYGLPDPKHTIEINYDDAINPDIIEALEYNYTEACRDTSNFYQQFKGKTLYDTCYNVWKWGRDYIRYKEDGQTQRIKMPPYFVSVGKGDCKSFALFCCSILAHYAPVAFVYVSYDSDPTPTHVYTYVKDTDGSIIIVDCCWNHFDAEKKCYGNYKYVHWMKVITMRGVRVGSSTASNVAEYIAMLNAIKVMEKLPANSPEYLKLKKILMQKARVTGVRIGDDDSDGSDDTDDMDDSVVPTDSDDTVADLFSADQNAAPADATSTSGNAATNNFLTDLAAATTVAAGAVTDYETIKNATKAPIVVKKTVPVPVATGLFTPKNLLIAAIVLGGGYALTR
jgi:hypothetical protein